MSISPSNLYLKVWGQGWFPIRLQWKFTTYYSWFLNQDPIEFYSVICIKETRTQDDNARGQTAKAYLPKSDLTDGLLGLLSFFFSSAASSHRNITIQPFRNDVNKQCSRVLQHGRAKHLRERHQKTTRCRTTVLQSSQKEACLRQFNMRGPFGNNVIFSFLWSYGMSYNESKIVEFIRNMVIL